MSELLLGDCVEVMAGMDAGSVDAVVTDPPYSIGFMGRSWDSHNDEDAAFGYYLSGLIDGEGYFRVSAKDRRCEFAMKLRADDEWILRRTLAFIGHGRISSEPRREGSAPQRRLIIDTKAGVAALCALLLRYPLRAKKLRDFLTWAEAVDEWLTIERGNRWHGPADRTRLSELGQRLRDGRSYSEIAWSGNGYQDWTRLWASECLRVLKPGGHLVSFGGTRTYHRLAAGVEDAGFEIRDQLAWLFGSGFPKSRNLGDGYGTALKPAHEPIVLARKPLVGTVADNVALHGVGGLNIDGCRIAIEDRAAYEANHSGDRGHAGTRDAVDRGATDLRPGGGSASDARWPANVVLDEEAAAMLDAQTQGTRAELPSNTGTRFAPTGAFPIENSSPVGYEDSGGASRFFYCAKTSRAERNAGLEGFDASYDARDNGFSDKLSDTKRPRANGHPTVKPLALMRWLARLITPPGGLILDPFLGSGTTGIAAALEGFRFVGIEREPDYMAIAQARIQFWETHGDQALRIAYAIDERETILATGQTSLLDQETAA